MRQSTLPSAKSAQTDSSLHVSELKKYTEGWLLTCEIARHSVSTLTNRRLYIRNLFWFLNSREYDTCGVNELRQFFAYLSNGHKEPGGRWGNSQQTRPNSPGTVATYHRHLAAMFRWIVDEGVLDNSPMARIPAPVDRPDQVEPFTSEQMEALLAAARKSLNAKRDEAILLFLLDTGARASELCDLVLEDVDVAAKSARIRDGKGGKDRTVYLGRTSVKAVWSYLKEDSRRPGDPIFGSRDGGPMNRTSLLKLIKRLGKEAGISDARCSPHTFRHTCALSFLRAGGNQLSLMSLLGHTDMKMTARYVHLAQADVERQHRQFSPADNLKSRR